MKKILYLLAIIFLLSLVLSKHARTVFSDALGWYEYEVTHTFQRAQTNVNDTQFLIDEGFIPINNLAFAGMWGKKDKRFKDGTKDNQATKNRVIAKGAAYSLILCLIHGSDAWKNEFQGKLK